MINNKSVLLCIMVVLAVRLYEWQDSKQTVKMANNPMREAKKDPSVPSICPDGSDRGLGYVPVGMGGARRKELGEVLPNARWVAVKLPDDILTPQMDRYEIYMAITSVIEEYRSKVSPITKLGLVAHWNESVGFIQRMACNCQGVGLIPSEHSHNFNIELAIQRSICENRDHHYWNYTGSRMEACEEANEELWDQVMGEAEPELEAAQEQSGNAEVTNVRDPSKEKMVYNEDVKLKVVIPDTKTPMQPVVTDIKNTTAAVNTTATEEAVKAQERDLKLCKSLEDVYPGTLIKEKWFPKNCALRRYSPTMAAACMKARPLLAIGDSLARTYHDWSRFMFKYSTNKSDHEMGPTYSNHIWNPSTLTEWGTLTRGSDKMGPKDQMQFLKETAQFMLYSDSVWDIGGHFCGTDHFFDIFREKIRKYRAAARSDAQMVLYDIPFIHRGKVSLMDKCTHPEKVEIFREMIYMAASCEGLGVFNIYDIQKASPDSTRDGIHIWHEGNTAASEVLFNVMCNNLAPIYPTVSCTPEDLSAAKARWRSHPIANSNTCGTGGKMCRRSGNSSASA